MSKAFDQLSDSCRASLRRCSQPAWIEPMLATLTESYFSDPDWIYERKLDGVRCLVFKDGDKIRIVSRNRRSMNAAWPELVEDLERESCSDFIADGEIVAFEGARTSFSKLQHRIGIRKAKDAREQRTPVYLYLFDILHLDGYDTSALAQRERKALLKRALAFDGRIRYTPHRNERGVPYLEEACTKGWEGIIAKDALAPYARGRSRRWLKFKCVHQQELVIGGFTEPRGSRKGFGALLVGYYENGELRYAGKVGTGFDDATLTKLAERLRSIEREPSPFSDALKDKSAHFVEPKLVGEFGFTEWTGSGKLRHPRFLGLRSDKEPESVRRERPAA